MMQTYPQWPTKSIKRLPTPFSFYNDFVSAQLDKLDDSRSIAELADEVALLQQKLRRLQDNGYPIYEKDGATMERLQRWLDQM